VTDSHTETAGGASGLADEVELRANPQGTGRVADGPEGVAGVNVVAVGEAEEQIVGGDVLAAGVVDGGVLSETDDDLEVVVQPGDVEGRQKDVATEVEVGVDGVEVVGGVVVDLPVVTVGDCREGRVDGFGEGQEQTAEGSGGRADLVDPVTLPNEAGDGAGGLAATLVHGDVVVGDVVAVETVAGGSVQEIANGAQQGEDGVGGGIKVGGVDTAVLNDVVAGAETVGRVGVELLAGKASRVGASASAGGLVVGLARQRARGDVEGTGAGVVGEAARVSRVSGALAGGGVEGGTAEAVSDGRAVARASVLVVGLDTWARGDDERAGGGGVGEAARVSGEGRASASCGAEGGAARAGQNVRATARASLLVVGLEAGARRNVERAGSSVVGEAAWVSGERRALASSGVEGGGARTSQDRRALALARGLVVGLWSWARRDVERAGGGVVGEAALVSGVGSALARGVVEGGTAEAVGRTGITALAGAGALAVNLRSVAGRDDESAGGGVVNQVARAGGESRARASGCVEGGAARAGQNRRALALAGVSRVNLRGRA